MSTAPDGLIVKNQTQENVRLAIFKKSYRQATLGTVAWQIVSPPINGQTTVQVPATFQVYVNYPGPNDSKSDPTVGNQTNILNASGYTGRFLVTSTTTPDKKTSVANLSQVFTDLIPEEMQVENQASFGVWSHIALGGADVFPSQIVSPGSVLLEDVRPTLYLAVVSDFIEQGDRLLEREISAHATPILVGQVATVTGSQWTGYSIAVAG